MNDIKAAPEARLQPEASKYIVFLCNTTNGVIFHLSKPRVDNAEAVCGENYERSMNNWVPTVFDNDPPTVCEKCRSIRLMERLAE